MRKKIKKIAKKEKPKPPRPKVKVKVKKKVVKKKPPKKVASKRPPKKVAAKKPMAKPKKAKTYKRPGGKVAKKKPRRTGPPPAKAARRRGPTRLELAARAKAKAKKEAKNRLTKSLSFLSSAPSKFSVKPAAYVQSDKKKYKDDKTVGSNLKKGKAVLSKVSDMKVAQGPIQTRSARSIERGIVFSEDGVRGGMGKSLNQVQGKVTINDLYQAGGSGSGGEVGGALSGAGGITLTGKGKIAEALIEKALAKRLHKLQYCYEKSLLSDPSLGGTLTMAWDLNTRGKASKVKVVRSQINNTGLHKCVAREISAIPFPGPKGGTVTIKKRFSFSSTSL